MIFNIRSVMNEVSMWHNNSEGCYSERSQTLSVKIYYRRSFGFANRDNSADCSLVEAFQLTGLFYGRVN